MRLKYLCVVVLLCCAVVVSHSPKTRVVPRAESLDHFPAALGPWFVQSKTMFDAPTLNVLRPSDYLMRTYGNTRGERLSLYVGYHDGGDQSGPIHSPRNCLPSSGWLPGESRDLHMQVGGETINMVKTVFAKDDREMICYYWYQVRDTTLNTDIGLKLAGLKGMLMSGRQDASFIRVDVFQKTDRPDELVHDFLQQAYPALRSFLPS